MIPGAEANLTAVLLTYGPLGVVLAWFMLRGEAKLEKVIERLDLLGHKITGVTKAMLVDVLSREPVDSKARHIAQMMLAEMEADSVKEAAEKKKK